MLRHLSALAAMMAAVLALAGCGGDESQLETYTADNGDEFNDADVTFATDMMPHHAQALQMVDLTVGRDLDPQIEQLAEQVRAAQAPEIDLMAGWLTAWDQPVPETARDHANADGSGGMEMDSDMAGMMSEQELSALEAARGAEFETRWLELMIEHHEGAVEMAETEQADGRFVAAVELAGAIESSQQAEIARMERLLG